MKFYEADLHIHTALSPCALEEMTPHNIVRQALYEHLDMIAVCDHNTADNAAAVQHAAANTLVVIAGIEITTSEEIHVLGLFPDSDAAQAVGNAVRATLPRLTHKTKRFPAQLLLDADGTTVGTEKKMLSAASTYALADAIALIHAHNGLVVASHVDRPSFSVFSQLGVFPDDVVFDGIEISAIGVDEKRYAHYVHLGLPMLASSDSHFLSDIGSCVTTLRMREPSFAELSFALHGVGGRACRIA